MVAIGLFKEMEEMALSPPFSHLQADKWFIDIALKFTVLWDNTPAYPKGSQSKCK